MEPSIPSGHANDARQATLRTGWRKARSHSPLAAEPVRRAWLVLLVLMTWWGGMVHVAARVSATVATSWSPTISRGRRPATRT